MNGRITIAAFIAAALIHPGPAGAQERTFACRYGNGDMDEITARTTNGGMSQILAIYRDRHDAAYIRAQCQAFANGEPFDISCLDNRRNWDAIEASIPTDYFGMSAMSLSPFVVEERAKGTGHTEALEFCRSVGAIK